MKCLFLTISALFAVHMNYASAGPNKEEMLKLFEKCRQQESVGPEILEGFKDKKLPDTPQGKCLLACMFEETGVMKAGAFSKDGALSFADKLLAEKPEKMDKAKQLIDTCSSEVSSATGDRCEVAFTIAECAKKNVESFHFHDDK